MKGKLLVVFVLILLVAGVATWRLLQKPSSRRPNLERIVRIGYYGGTCEAPIYVAYENGCFKQHGLNVELVKIDGTVMKEGIATGKLDAVQITPGEFKSMEQGLDIVITDGVHTGCIQAVAPAGSRIKSVADLKGKAIGCEVMGGAPMTFLSMELLRVGLDPKKDVQWKVYPPPQLSTALAKKEIDAFCTWDPFPQIAVNEGKAKVFFSNTASYPYADQYCCFVGVNGKVAREEPEIARAITAAFADADRMISDDPDRVAHMAVDMKYISGDAALNGFLLGKYQYLANDAQRARKSYRYFLKGMADLKMLDAGTNIDTLLEKTFSYMGAVKPATAPATPDK